MASTSTGAIAASNYDSLSPRERRDLSLKQSGNTLKVSEKNVSKGLVLKPAGQINKFDLTKGSFRSFQFVGGAAGETLAIGKKAKVTGAVNLGKDNNVKDVIKAKGNFKGVVQEFKGPDEFQFKGKTYDAGDVRADGTIKGVGGVKFNT